MTVSMDPLTRARQALAALRTPGAAANSDREESEGSEESPQLGGVRRLTTPPTDSFLRWRLLNAERLTAGDLAAGHDAGGYCAEHRRCLSWPEQRRGACS